VRGATRRAGFTLLEMLAAMTLTATVLAAVISFYLDLSRASAAATQRTRDVRRATALLDRVARDLEAAVLVRKPEALDPLAHPWIFYAEARGRGEGASRLKFVTRGHVPRASAVHESDLEVVAYVLRPVEDGSFDLLRWSSPHLPPGQDLSFPRDEQDGALLLADGVARFGVRFMNESGEWQDEWNSGAILDSSELPRAAAISVALLPEEEEEAAAGAEPEELLRHVMIPLPPLDLEGLLEEAEKEQEEEEEEDKDCITVNQCLARNPNLFDAVLEAVPDLAAIGDECFSEYAGQVPVAVEGCE
jgi:type II secretion system protein J